MDSSIETQNSGISLKVQEFQKLAQIIGTSIQKISQNVTSMQRMVNQIGTHQDSAELRKQLHSIQHYTQQLAKDTSNYIKEMSLLPASQIQSEQRQRKMQRERLQDEYTTVLNLFQSAQRNTARKEKEIVNKTKTQQANDGFFDLSSKKDVHLIELQDNNSSTRVQQQIQEEIDLRALHEQEQSIQQLESDINDVNQIFKELGTLVHEQGETLDSIEANVERTNEFVRQGAQQLHVASNYSSKLRKRKCILAGILAIIFTIIIIIIIWKTS